MVLVSSAYDRAFSFELAIIPSFGRKRNDLGKLPEIYFTEKAMIRIMAFFVPRIEAAAIWATENDELLFEKFSSS